MRKHYRKCLEQGCISMSPCVGCEQWYCTDTCIKVEPKYFNPKCLYTIYFLHDENLHILHGASRCENLNLLPEEEFTIHQVAQQWSCC